MTSTTARPTSELSGDDPGWGAYFVRTSGLLLFVLLAAHLVDSFVLHDIQSQNMQTLTERWASPVWRAVDWALIVLALGHGVVGLRPLIGSGVTNPTVRGLVLALLYGVVAVLLALVTFVAFTFRFS